MLRSIHFIFPFLLSIPISSPYQLIKSSQHQLFWTQFRASLANRLILENFQNPSISPNLIYTDIFSTFPLNGNCWCYLDKTDNLALKGPPQDPYDTVCKHYHKCIYCGECQDVQPILNQGIYEEFTINVTYVSNQNFQNQNFLVDYNIEYLDLFNYDSATSTMSIYEWSCSDDNTIVAESVCICFKAFEDEFFKIMLDDISNSNNPDMDIDFNYNAFCERTDAPTINEINSQYLGYGFRSEDFEVTTAVSQVIGTPIGNGGGISYNGTMI